MSLHSSFNDKKYEQACGIAMPPIKTKVAGPAAVLQQLAGDSQIDIIDEALQFFRPNLLFKNYEINGPGDVFIIYMTVFITQCLRKVVNEEKEDLAQRSLVELARMPFPKYHEAGFFMRGIMKESQISSEVEKLASFMKQAKEELVLRLIKILYTNGAKSWDNKFWIGLSKRNFMNLKF